MNHANIATIHAGQRAHHTPNVWHAGYDVGPDGRFLMVALDEDSAPAVRRIKVVVNWFEELIQLAPTRGSR